MNLINRHNYRPLHSTETAVVKVSNDIMMALDQHKLAMPQYVQNAAARVIACISRREHISEIQIQLYWLPIQQRVT